MSPRRAHIGLHLTVLWPVLLGALGVLVYGAVHGGRAPSLAGAEPAVEGCLGERIAVEAWPAHVGPAAEPQRHPAADVSPVAADL